jgi:hypothetical protein
LSIELWSAENLRQRLGEIGIIIREQTTRDEVEDLIGASLNA